MHDPSRVLRFDLRNRRYAIRISLLTGVLGTDSIRPVCGAPDAVVGIAGCGGHLVTVLDLPTLVGDGPGNGAGCLVRLAPPLQNTALLVPARTQLDVLKQRPEPVPADYPAVAEGVVPEDGGEVVLLRPDRCVESLAGAIRAGGEA